MTVEELRKLLEKLPSDSEVPIFIFIRTEKYMYKYPFALSDAWISSGKLLLEANMELLPEE